MFNDFFNLIFPKTCFACHTALLKYEKIICTSCQFYLPKTNFHLESNNNLNKVFWGRVDVKKAASFYYFNKGGKVQNLLHELKYKGAKEVGERIGELYGLELLNTDFLKGIDLIIPVPLHVKKLKKRGCFNFHFRLQPSDIECNKAYNNDCPAHIQLHPAALYAG